MDIKQAAILLAKVLPPGPYLSLHNSNPGKCNPVTKKPYQSSMADSRMDRLLYRADCKIDRDDVDWWFCTASMHEAEESDFQGKKILRAKRVTQNIAGHKCFFADVDVKPTGYPDTRAAIEAIKDFLKKSGLPWPNAWVLSGSGGVHIYWTLIETLTTDQWRPLAQALANAIKQHGLHCDTQCTVDPTRILRLPGTRNQKPGAGDVRILHILPNDYFVSKMDLLLNPYKGAPAHPISTGMGRLFEQPPTEPPLEFPDDAVDDLGEDITPYSDPIVGDDAAKGCPWLGAAYATGGRDHDQPQWNLAVLSAVFMQDGQTEAHRLGCGHKDYDPVTTDAMFVRKQNERVTRNLGWPSCDAINNAGSKECASCPHLGQHKTPFNFIVRPQPAAPQATAFTTAAYVHMNGVSFDAFRHLPERYDYQNNYITFNTEDDQEKPPRWRRLIDHRVYKAWLSILGGEEYAINFECETSIGRFRTVKLTYGEILETSFGSTLVSHGLAIQKNDIKQVGSFMVSWIQQLKNYKEATVLLSGNGWTEEDGKRIGFTFDGKTWMEDGSSKVGAKLDKGIADVYTKAGTLQKWKDAVALFNPNQNGTLNALLATAFAGPLMAFSDHHGVVLSFYSSDSGIGKSSTTKIAQAVWGAYAGGVQGVSDTDNAIAKKMGDLRNIPLYWDELQSRVKTETVAQLVFQLASGSDKQRLNRNASSRETRHWKSMMVIVSNISVFDIMARTQDDNVQGHVRLFEIQVDQKKWAPDIVIKHALAEVTENYGHAGEIYAQYIARNMGRIKSDLMLMEERLLKMVGGTTESRFYLSAIAILLLGAVYANNCGLTLIDLGKMRDALLETYKRMDNRRQTEITDINTAEGLVGTLGDFLTDVEGTILRTNDIITGKGKPKNGSVMMQGINQPKGVIKAQIGSDTGLVIVHKAAFKDWLIKRKLPAGTMIEKMTQILGVEEKQCSFGAGVIGMEKGVQTRVLLFSFVNKPVSIFHIPDGTP